jgi:hypothetical protein
MLLAAAVFSAALTWKTKIEFGLPSPFNVMVPVSANAAAVL